MEARFKAPAQSLTALFETLGEISKAANLCCNAERGMTMQAMDDSHVSLFLLTFPPASLEHFRCTSEFTIGLNFKSLLKMLKCAHKNDIVTLQYNPSATKTSSELLILIESAEGSRLSDFSLKLIDIDEDTLMVPDVEFGAKVTLPMFMLQRVVRDFFSMADTMLISVGKHGLKCSFSGDDGSGCVTMAQSDTLRLELKEAIAMNVSLRYMMLFCKAVSFAEQGVLSLQHDVPLRLACVMGDGAGVDFFLAPKIED